MIGYAVVSKILLSNAVSKTSYTPNPIWGIASSWTEMAEIHVVENQEVIFRFLIFSSKKYKSAMNATPNPHQTLIFRECKAISWSTWGRSEYGNCNFSAYFWNGNRLPRELWTSERSPSKHLFLLQAIVDCEWFCINKLLSFFAWFYLL